MTTLPVSRRRRLVTAVVALGSAAALTGCGSNINALTQQWYDPTDGANNSVEGTLAGMAVRDIVVVSDGTDATVIGTFVNAGRDTDEVTDIMVEGASVTITGDLEVDPGDSVRLGPPGQARAQVNGADLAPGSYTDVEISFGSAPRAELMAVVRAPDGPYEESGPE